MSSEDPLPPVPGAGPEEPKPKYGEQRERPQYGEYATPQEVAHARGIPFDRSNEHVDRLAEPLPVAPSSSKGAPAKKPTAPEPGVRRAAPPTGRPVLVGHPGQPSPLVTVLLLVFGIWNTVTSIPSFLDLGSSLSQGLAAAGYGSITFGAVTHVVGIALLVFSFLVLIAAVGLSFRRIRAGRSSFWVPLVAAAVWVVGLVIGMIVVVANTPGVTTLMQNHS